MDGVADLLDRAQLAVLVADASGRLLEVNECAAVMFGLDRHRLRRTFLANLLPPAFRMTARDLRSAARSTGRPAEGEVEIEARSGGSVRATVLAVPLAGGGDEAAALLWLVWPRAAAGSVGRLQAAMWRLASTPSTAATLDRLLADLAEMTLLGIPNADGTSVTLLDPVSIGASDAQVRRADQLQRDAGEGPGMTALQTGAEQHTGDVGADPRWPRVGPQLVEQCRYRSVLAVPLGDATTMLGLLNAYAAAQDAFSREAVDLARTFAGPASAALVDAHAHRKDAHLAANLENALASRAVIDQAIGVLMARERIDADAAMALLREVSQRSNVKLRSIAADLVRDAPRR